MFKLIWLKQEIKTNAIFIYYFSLIKNIKMFYN